MSHMSSNKYVIPLRLDIKPSRKLLVFILACHGLTFVSIFMLSFGYAVVLGSGILLSLVHSLKQQGYLSNSNMIDKLVLGTDNLWTINRCDGTQFIAQLKPDTYVNTFIVILSLAVEGRWLRHRVVIMSDATDEHAFRHLRVHLNTQT